MLSLQDDTLISANVFLEWPIIQAPKHTEAIDMIDSYLDILGKGVLGVIMGLLVDFLLSPTQDVQKSDPGSDGNEGWGGWV